MATISEAATNGHPYAEVAKLIDPRARLRRAWSLTGGVSALTTALELVTPSGSIQKLVVRQLCQRTMERDRNAAAHEFALLQLLHAAELPVPRPRLLDESRKLLPQPFLVLDFVDGAPEFSPRDAQPFVEQLAQLLADIHVRLTTLPHLAVQCPFLPHAIDRVAARLNEVAVPVESDATRRVVSAHRVLHKVWPIRQQNRSLLLHGDFWTGNVLWAEGHLTGIIDWEDTCIGDPLLDLAIARLEILWLLGRDAMQAFTRHYLARNPIDCTNLPYWDLYAVLRPGSELKSWAAVWPSVGRADLNAKAMQESCEWLAAQALATVE